MLKMLIIKCKDCLAHIGIVEKKDFSEKDIERYFKACTCDCGSKSITLTLDGIELIPPNEEK
jgi:hypothetical protein